MQYLDNYLVLYNFIIGYSPINTVFSTNLTKDIVDLNKIFNLTCSADANPAAKYRLYRGQENVVNITDGQSSGTFLTSVNNRVKQVTYRCIPFNSFGDGPTKTVNVTVYCKYLYNHVIIYASTVFLFFVCCVTCACLVGFIIGVKRLKARPQTALILIELCNSE